MALDKATAARLWDQRYRKYLEQYSLKNKYLDPEGLNDPQNLMSDLAMNVFVKAVNAFDQGKVGYTADADRAFNAFFTQILGQYTSNLAAHRDTGKSKYTRDNQRSLDAPRGSGDDEEGNSFLDVLQSHDHDPAMQLDMEKMMQKLPENLRSPLKYIIENLSAGDVSDVMGQVRDKFGWTQTRLFNALAEQPAFTSFISEI